MSHTVTVNMVADHFILIDGVPVNIHDIKTIYVSSKGLILNAFIETHKTGERYVKDRQDDQGA